MVACVLLAFGAIRAEDRVLVPLDAADTDRWLSRVLGALDDIDRGKYREAIDVLQAGVLEGEGRGLPGGGSAVAKGRPGHRANAVIFRVHAPIGRGTSSLRAALAPAPADDTGADADAPPQRAGASRRHLPLSRICLAALSSLPPDGLRVYRDLHDQAALRVLAEGGSGSGNGAFDAAEKRVASELFLTSSGDDCAERVGDAAFEAGEPREAAAWWRKVLEDYPDSDIPAARLRAKVLHALRLAGDEGNYLIERERFLESAGGSGRETVAAIERSVPLVRPADRPPPAEPSRWGGELHASRPPDLAPPPAAGGLLQPPSGGAPAAPAPAFRLSWDSWLWSRRGVDGASRADGNVLFARGFGDPGLVHFPFVPLLEGDSVYLSGVFSMFRLDAKARKGSVVSDYKKPASDELQGYVERSEGPLYTVTSWKRDLDPGAPEGSPTEALVTSYVSDRIKAADFMGYDITVEIPIRSLAAFDPSSGKLLWKTGKDPAPADPRGVQPRRVLRARPEAPVDDEEDPFPDFRRRKGRSREVDDAATVKEFSYTSPVIVRRGLVIAGGWMQRGYVSSLVRALDIRTGALVWETLLSSSQLELTMFGEMAREPFGGMIEEHDDVIYYSTQMGVIAALEMDSGRIRWLTTYDVIEVQASLHRQAVKRRIVWGPNPLLVVGNALIVTPRDSEQLYAIDTGRGPGGPLDGGRILWQAHNPDRHTQLGADLRDLLGHAGGHLYFSSPTGLTSLDLSALDPAGNLPAGRLEPRRARWPAPTSNTQVISGSGALTSSGIVYCDGESLGLVSLDLRRQAELVPRPLRRGDLGAQSELGTYPGRIQVSPGLILMTSRHFVSAFTLEPGPIR